jgi:hypothetical protein
MVQASADYDFDRESSHSSEDKDDVNPNDNDLVRKILGPRDSVVVSAQCDEIV